MADKRKDADLVVRGDVDIQTIPCPKCGKTGLMVYDGRNSSYTDGIAIERYVCSRESRDPKTGFVCGGTIDHEKEDALKKIQRMNAKKILKRDGKSGQFIPKKKPTAPTKAVPTKTSKGGKR